MKIACKSFVKSRDSPLMYQLPTFSLMNECILINLHGHTQEGSSGPGVLLWFKSAEAAPATLLRAVHDTNE